MSQGSNVDKNAIDDLVQAILGCSLSEEELEQISHLIAAGDITNEKLPRRSIQKDQSHIKDVPIDKSFRDIPPQIGDHSIIQNVADIPENISAIRNEEITIHE